MARYNAMEEHFSDGCLDIDLEKDWDFAGGNSRTVKEFQKKYPSVKKKEREQYVSNVSG